MGRCCSNTKILDEISSNENQSHLLKHWNNLPSHEKRDIFLEQLNLVDLKEVTRMYQKSFSISNGKTEHLSTAETKHSSPDEDLLLDSMVLKKEEVSQEKEELLRIGLEAISKGEGKIFGN
jgi:hypothetical protein